MNKGLPRINAPFMEQIIPACKDSFSEYFLDFHPYEVQNPMAAYSKKE